ncbi:hypothetical protein [Pseudoalteromonas sp. TAB23]|uniref:hypothetical protein n=1 Tax=Pseudoalteromonas sp. TAB23 TaxID=1938595 RepID=UPI001111647D|nr:hypothetical protein [Pseudoalteromonas sp. TAB23]
MKRIITGISSGEYLYDKVTISSIEPSLARNTKEAIVLLELPLSIVSVECVDITDQHRSSWQDDFDEEDYGDVSMISNITIQRNKG